MVKIEQRKIGSEWHSPSSGDDKSRSSSMVNVRLLAGAEDSLPLPSVHSHITLRPSSAQAGPFSHVSSGPQAPNIMPGMEWTLSKVTVS